MAEGWCQYYAGILALARRDTARFLRDHFVAEGLIAAAAVVIPSVGILWSNRDDSLGANLLLVGQLVGLTYGALLLAIVAVLFWNLVWAPVNASRQQHLKVGESEKQLERVSTQLHQQAWDGALLWRLADLHEKGRQLIDGAILGGGDQGLARWAVEQWRHDVTRTFVGLPGAWDRTWDYGSKSGTATYIHEGATFSGDRAVLANEMDLSLKALISIMDQHR